MTHTCIWSDLYMKFGNMEVVVRRTGSDQQRKPWGSKITNMKAVNCMYALPLMLKQQPFILHVSPQHPTH